MAYTNLPVPEGFEEKLSFIRWHGEFWVIPEGSGSYVKHLLPPAGGATTIRLDPATHGVVRVLCYLVYKLTTIDQTSMRNPIEVREEGAYQFGCDWDYSFTGNQVLFGPYERFTIPATSKIRLLQGSCEDMQSSKFRDPKAFVYFTMRLNVGAIPGTTSAWSIQWPEFGGPAYTLPGFEGTPSANPATRGYHMQFDVPVPMTITPLLDPNLPLGVTVTYKNEKDVELETAQLKKLFDWVDQIKDSNLLPAIQKRYLRMQMQSHASKTGDPTANIELTIQRAAKVKGRLDLLFGTFIEIVANPRGAKDARSLDGIKRKDYNTALRDDRNVTLYFEESQVTAALARDVGVVAP